ncbi:MAG: O-antigen biosynthesis protein WbqP [Patiriisocius sp.]|jgi:O-antigen biosynthesis protein WbqP
MRLFDFLFALFGLIILSPLLILLAVFAFFDTGSPIFRQVRVGKHQKPFNLYKFRSMSLDTISVATHLAQESSITRFGKFIRGSKFDELPQLVNVLRGDMSLVGPRPCLFNQEELIAARQSRLVFEVLPGITGLAQVNGVDMSDPEKLAEWDERMIKQFSIIDYFKYLIMTVVGRGFGDRIRS